MGSERITTAAGGIVWRKSQTGVEVQLIHRPSYDDWTFPKGKTDLGESLQATAVREIAEETGLRVRLGHPLGEISYVAAAGGDKVVTYWCARPVGDEAAFQANDEVDEIRWVGVKGAAALLTYERDQVLLGRFRQLLERKAHRTRTVVVLRHGQAAPRDQATEDLERPLTEAGRERADALVPVLEAYGIRLVVSSPAARCVQTVEPYAQSISTFLEIDDRLGDEARAGQVQRSVDALLERKSPVVMCTHRPTLPWVFESVGTQTHDLAPGEGVVLHHRRGEVFAVEILA